jgi:hypothetical protein
MLVNPTSRPTSHPYIMHFSTSHRTLPVTRFGKLQRHSFRLVELILNPTSETIPDRKNDEIARFEFCGRRRAYILQCVRRRKLPFPCTDFRNSKCVALNASQRTQLRRRATFLSVGSRNKSPTRYSTARRHRRRNACSRRRVDNFPSSVRRNSFHKRCSRDNPSSGQGHSVKPATHASQ